MLEHQGKTSGGLQVQGGPAQALLANRIGGLAPIAEAMDRLGGEAEVGHHRDAAAHQPVNHRHGFRFAPLQFHRRGRAVLEHGSRGRHGPIEAALVAQKRQVADQQGLAGGRTAQAPADGAAVLEHLLQGHRQGGGMAEHHHRQGIAHQHHIGAGGLHQGCREGIPGRQHGNGPAVLFELEQITGTQGHRSSGAQAHC